MRHSIKRQMAVVCTGLVVFTLIAFLVINGRFLEQYYISNKQKNFTKVYKEMNHAAEEETLQSNEVKAELFQEAERGNISYAVMSGDGFGTLIWNAEREDGLLQGQLIGYLLGKNQEMGQLLKKTDHYEIRKLVDPRNKSEYIEMCGTLENDYIFILRSPLESIRESVAISNQFLIYVGIVMILLSILLVWFFSRRITEPILELAVLSRRMADLDFDARYTSGGDNEIGVLGESFNTMSKKLETTISELKAANCELQKDIEKKEQIESMRIEFLGNVSHELKTPIALIQGYAEGLKEGVNQDEESRGFYCEVIMDEADKMNQMVKNLLTLNQLEFGDEEVGFERFNMTELISGVVQSYEILIQQRAITVSFQEKESVYVWADEFKVEQVVRNYISNALNHVVGDEKVIEIKVVMRDSTARITVFNTGAPIPNEDVEHIWDKFYKVDKARSREYGGNGIGLSIVKAIMDSFNQPYGVKNYDNGVKFWFELDVK